MLVIEPDAAERERAGRILTRAGFEARTSASLRPGLVRHRDESADAVLLGVDLPEPEALELVRRLRAIEPELPIVVVSRFDGAGSGREIVRAGAQEWLLRDEADPRRLVRSIELAIEREQAAVRAREARIREILSREVQLQMKDQLIARVSHELRTPLSGMHAMLTLLAEGFGGELTLEQSSYVADALRSADRLDRLLADLLDVRRIQLGRLDLALEPIRLRDIVQESVQSMAGRARAKHQSLEIGPHTDSDRVLGDRLRLAQVLTNLLDNAVKSAPEEGRVRVSISAEEERVLVAVDDDGPGLDPGEREKVFQSLRQLTRGTPGDGGGLGLGLHIAREIVELHGGAIGVETSDLGGARFFFTLDQARSGCAASRN